MQKIFLEDLPKWESGGNKGRINWSKSIGWFVPFIYEDIEGTVKIIDYIPQTHCLYIKYLDKELYKIQTGGFQKCQLGKLLGKITTNFKVEIGSLFCNNKRNLIIINREYRDSPYKVNNKIKWYQYKCNVCGHIDWITENILLRGVGCSCCNSKQSVLGINTIWDTDRWLCDLGVSEKDAKLHTRSSDKKISVTCPHCQRTKMIKIDGIYRHKSISCICGDGKSYPEKFMFNILEQLNVKFETEKRFDWCKYIHKGKEKQGIFDFYFELNDKKYIIEMDGGFHFRDNKMNGITKKRISENR